MNVVGSDGGRAGYRHAHGPPDERCEVDAAQPSSGVRAPSAPTVAEREEHRRTHFPFRSWCDECVAGCAFGHPHFSHQKDPERYALPHVAGDYWFMGGQSEDSRENTPVRVMYEKTIHWLFAHVV